MKIQSYQLPRLASWLLKFLSVPGHDHVLLGDISEEYDFVKCDQGRFKAYAWIWGQVIISVPAFFKSSIYWSFSMVKSTVTIACRHMRRHKTFSFINIMGLAVSLSIGLLVIKLIMVIYSSDRFHE